ncbi:hypothetical protein ACIPUC_14780 [Streptomyces sp. LARHCF249]
MSTPDRQITINVKRRITAAASALLWAFFYAIAISHLTKLATDIPWVRAMVAAAVLLIVFPPYYRHGHNKHERSTMSPDSE